VRAWGSVLVLAVVGLLLPAGTMAKPGYFTSPGFRTVEARMHGTHGYRLQVLSISGGFSVNASKGHTAVSYFPLHVKLDGDRVAARLPGVGWVFLHFRELKRYRRKSADNCRGPGSLVRRGVFEGWIRIDGERNYTHVDAHHVPGKIVRDERQICRRRPAARASDRRSEQTLLAETPRGRGTLSFSADEWPQFGGRSPLFFSASLLRQRGPMLIANSNYAISEDTDALDVAKPPRSAITEPPAPFTGSAAFEQESADKFSWLGDLQVELPGIGDVALAGPRFKSSLCIGHRCRGDSDETFGFVFATAAAPTPIPWPKPGFPR
jgi:hypothetical protein